MPTRRAASPARQLAGCIAKFDPRMQRLIRACRATLRKRFPTANELVYDNYNFFVIGYSPTERPSDSVVSLTANARVAGLCFIYGASLADPQELLQGAGSQTRFLRLASARTLSEPGVASLIRTAIADADPPFRRQGRPTLVVRSISKKQRPRR